MSINAYWLTQKYMDRSDNSGSIIKPESRHILAVVNHPEKFGETEEILETTFNLYGEQMRSNIEGKARHAVLLRVIKRGFVRIRTNRTRRSQHWSVQVNILDLSLKNIIWMWAKQVSSEQGSDKFADVVVHELGRSDNMIKTTLEKIVSGEAFGEEFVQMLKEREGKEVREIKVYNESDLVNFPNWIDIAHNIDPDSLGDDAKKQIADHRKELFLNLAYILKKGGRPLEYGEPWKKSSDILKEGFTIIMYHIDNDGYAIATKILEILGCKHINRECGPTIAALFDTVEENENCREAFVTAMTEAEKQLDLLGDKHFTRTHYT